MHGTTGTLAPLNHNTKELLEWHPFISFRNQRKAKFIAQQPEINIRVAPLYTCPAPLDGWHLK